MRTVTYWVSLGLILTIPFKEIVVIPGLGSISLILGLVVAGAWLLTVFYTGIVRSISVFHWVAFTFFLWNFISILWSIDVDNSIERASTFARMALFVWMIWDLYDSRQKIWSGAQAYVIGCWVNMGSLFFNFANNVEAYRNANGRFAATGFNTNETGIILALGLPLAWYLATANPLDRRTPRPLFWLNIVYLPAAIFAIGLTASRGSLLATLPVLLVILVTAVRVSSLHRVVLAVGIVAAGFFLISFVPEENLERFGTTSSEIAANDLNGRVAVWRDGFEIFEAHMLVGTGAGTFRTALATGKAAHNVFVAIGVELGITGLFLFGCLLLLVLSAIWRYRPVERLIWLSFLLVWLTGSMVGNWEHENVSWLFLCLIVKGAALSEKRLHKPRKNFSPHPTSLLRMGVEVTGDRAKSQT